MRAAAGTRRDPGASELLTAAPPRPSPAAARVSPCVSQPTSPFLSRGGEAAGFLLSRSVSQSVSQQPRGRAPALPVVRSVAQSRPGAETDRC